MTVQTPSRSFQVLRQRSDTISFYSTFSTDVSTPSAGRGCVQRFEICLPEKRFHESSMAGKWTMIPSSVEGLEAFLEVSKVGWVKRKAALALSKSFIPKIEIITEGSQFLTVSQGPRGIDTREFVVDGPSFSS